MDCVVYNIITIVQSVVLSIRAYNGSVMINDLHPHLLMMRSIHSLWKNDGCTLMLGW